MTIEAKTRKTREGYFQPVLIIDGKIKHSPKDMAQPCLDRKTAQKQAEQWRKESMHCGYITFIG